MRISLNWLKDYLDIRPDADIELISNTLTMAGLEVEAIEDIGQKSQQLEIGEILSGAEGKLELLVNGENLMVADRGDLFPGTFVAFNRFLTKDERSLDGEIADFSHLGFSQGAAEIISFAREFFEGDVPENLSQVKEFSDTIVTLGITPNRADALSHLGVSRELGALLDLNSRSPMLTPKEMAGDTHEKVAIEIEDAADCPRYACRVAEVTIGPSPLWLKMRLLASGIRPINNVVDVTNYVMLSRGQPMHAFNYEKLEMSNGRAKIAVRRAKADEPFVALDGQKLKLSDQDVVITDSNKVLALAGVIGGLDSSIDNSAKTILLESAYFDPKNVRLSARRHGIGTESSYRFERGADPNGVVDALNYAARLLTEISDAKVCRDPIDAYRKRIDPEEVKMRPERAQAILGLDDTHFDQELLRKRFLRLGIETVAKRGDAIYFRVPTYRSDLKREIDLVEEAARMIGYDKVNQDSSPQSCPQADFYSRKVENLLKKIRQVISMRGFSEAVNYAFLNKEFQKHFLPDEPIAVLNPLSDRYGVMRLSLIPGLIKNLLHNQRNQEKSILLFEQGTVFLGYKPEGKKPRPETLFGTLDQDSFSVEKQKFSGVMLGKLPFQAFDQGPKDLDFYHLKGVLSEALSTLGLSAHILEQDVFFEDDNLLPYLHPKEASTIVYGADRLLLGHCGRLHPQVAQALEITGNPYVFELDVEALSQVSEVVPRFKPFSRYPLIERDVAFVVDEDVKVGDILKAALELDEAKLVHSINVFDIYRGKNLGADKKSVAVSMILKREDRTLTDDEAESFVNGYVDVVKARLGAQVRQ